ncbi:hypothetical protein BJX65DRAFT_310284 [Aspergillus insuetus]
MVTASFVSTPLALNTNTTKQALRHEASQPASQSPIIPLGPNSNAAATDPGIRAACPLIKTLFDHLYTHSADVASLNATLADAHKKLNINFRLCDYNPTTAAPESENGCGAHTDYGTFKIIFQDGTAGLELEDSAAPGGWRPVPGDATVILSGGWISAARHRVRRVPGLRRLSVALFLALDLNVKLQPSNGVKPVKPISAAVMRGELDVESFKEEMGKRWRYREGNEELEGGDVATQDSEIEKLVWA